MRYLTAFIVLIAWSGPVAAAAQPVEGQDAAFVHAEKAKIGFHPDGNYVFNFLPASDLVFEASVAPDVHVIDTVSKALETVLDGNRKRVMAYSIFGTFMFRLRMFDEDSNPVRTPSYMPKATVQLALMRDISRNLDTTPDRRVSMWLLSVIPFGHHSNGQNGCLFNEASRVNGECVGAEAIPVVDRTINERDGSFSTNYIRAGVHYRRMYLESAGGIPFAVARWQWSVGTDLEVNPTWYPIGGAINEDLHEIYGATRVKLSASAARLRWKRFGRLEGKAAFEYINDAPRGVSDVTSVLEFMALPAGWGGAGVFGRFYHGQDYYNLAFFRNITRFQFGLAFNQDRFLAFRQHLKE